MATDQAARVIRAVQAGVRWLRAAAQRIDEGRAAAVAASALIAAERNPHSHTIRRLVALLTDRQQANGSWADELWDTTWATRALIDAGIPPADPRVSRAIEFLRVTQDPVDGTWYEEPFETMLVLALLRDVDDRAFAECSSLALEWIASLQRNDGLLVGTRYTGMATSLFLRVPSHASSERVVTRGLDYLRAVLGTRNIWTGAAWSNAYAFNALVDGGLDVDDAAVDHALEWFLGSQKPDGRWDQVSEIHDTAMAILSLSRLLRSPLVDIPRPEVAVMHVARENGTLRVDFVSPDVRAIVPSERMKLSDSVRASLVESQRRVLAVLGRTRAATVRPVPDARDGSSLDELLRVGQYTYGHLVPPRIQAVLEGSSADHLRLDVDERLIDLPWELMHDGRDYLCARYAAGRRLVSDQETPVHPISKPQERRAVLVVANPTGDLPHAETEGEALTHLFRDQWGLTVEYARRDQITKADFLLSLRNYSVVHFAGHADHDADNPDESRLHFADGTIHAFELARFLRPPAPAVVFLNACWSAEETPDYDVQSPTVRGLGRTFLYAGVRAFIGYIVPIPDETARTFAVAFYSRLCSGFSVGEAVRLARLHCRASSDKWDLTWAAAVLYGEPSVPVFGSSGP